MLEKQLNKYRVLLYRYKKRKTVYIKEIKELVNKKHF
jgi:hypothetical protein